MHPQYNLDLSVEISVIVWPMVFTIVIVVEYLLQVWHDSDNGSWKMFGAYVEVFFCMHLLLKELWVVRVSRSWRGSIWCRRQAIRFLKRQVSGFGEGHYCDKQGAEARGPFSRAKVCGEREGSIQTLNLQQLIYYDPHVFLFLIVWRNQILVSCFQGLGLFSGFSI